MGYLVWNSVLRYEAYGTVSGRVIQVPAPQIGTVRSIHTRDGQSVRQGDLLVTLESTELNQQLERIRDELLIAQASLTAEISKLQWQARQQGDQAQRAVADYLELRGELLQQEAKLEELAAKTERDRALGNSGAISKEQSEEMRFLYAGLQAKVTSLRSAVDERKKLADASELSLPTEQLQPMFVQIETLKAEQGRLRELLQQGRIRAPVSGRVVGSRYFTGEQVEAGSVIMEILEEHSLEAVIYLPQATAHRISEGQALDLRIAPVGDRVPCTVARRGEQFVTVPPSLQRHYHKSEQVLPVHLRMDLDGRAAERLPLGCEVRLPASWGGRLFSRGRVVTSADTGYPVVGSL